MKLSVFARRFLLPSFLVSLIAFVKYRARVSPRSELELSPLLSLGPKTTISAFCKIKATMGPLSIGARTSIASGCFITSGEKGIRIGCDCLIGPSCTLISNSYRYTRIDQTFEEQGTTSKGTEIGDNVLLGAGTVVVDGARIGSGVMIAANSVVSGTIPDNAVIQGNPAKVIFVRR